MKSKLNLTWQGDMRVIDALFERKKNLEKGKGRHQDGRTFGILFNGGAQRGVLMGGVATALAEAGLTNMFDHAIGYSTGALGVWYFCAGEAKKGTRTYYTEGVEDNYIRQLHPWKMLDLKIVDRILRKEEPVDLNRLRAFPGKIHVGLTDAETGEGTFVDPRDFQDPIAPLIASSAIPFLDGKLSVELEGKRYVDGGIAWPLPVRYCIETLGCTDLIVLMTHPLQPARETIIDKIGNMIVPLFYPRSFVRLFRGRLQRYNQDIAYAKAPHADTERMCTIYPREIPFGSFSENKERMQEAAEASEEFMRNLLASRKK